MFQLAAIGLPAVMLSFAELLHPGIDRLFDSNGFRF